MKHHIQRLLAQAVDRVQRDVGLPAETPANIVVERSRDSRHGDFASPIALALARAVGRNPRELAELVIRQLKPADWLQRAEPAGPGFINFFLTPQAFHTELNRILELGEAYGRAQTGASRPMQVEFVSANPTGPLHVGHGRGAACGAAVANLLKATGFDVRCEYYVNDAGRQIDILAVSVWLRYLELCGDEPGFPASGYQGDYIWDIAAALHRERGEACRTLPLAAVQRLTRSHEGDTEQRMDALIQAAEELLGSERYELVREHTLDVLLKDIRDDLAGFGVVFDEWYRERALVRSGAVERAVTRLADADHIYERDGALWFRSTSFGDEKDRVLVRENGKSTYFASDVAYHMEKFERGFRRVIDVWGADHHGYVTRVKAALAALGEKAENLEVILVQFASLYRGGDKLQMSTRSGEFITLRQLRREVGNDAARFFYVLRKSDQHLDFDLDLATRQSNDNPVYYIQYAHARVCSVERQAHAQGWTLAAPVPGAALARLEERHERALLQTLTRYPEVIETAAAAREPHQLAFYLRELANDFHGYYNEHRFLVDDEQLRQGRLALVAATGQVIRNGLAILGVAAPESM